MSAAKGGKVSAGVAKLVDEALHELHLAQRGVAHLQQKFNGSGDTTIDSQYVWQKLETIDDRIHNALAKLGE